MRYIFGMSNLEVMRMKLARVLMCLSVIAVSGVWASSSWSQGEAIAERKALMREVGAATRTGTQMAREQIPFDAAKAREVFAVYQKSADQMPGLYPKGTETGGETSASPAVFFDPAGFKAAFAKFGADAKAAAEKSTDLEAFKAAFADVSRNCGSCHQTYRVQR